MPVTRPGPAAIGRIDSLSKFRAAQPGRAGLASLRGRHTYVRYVRGRGARHRSRIAGGSPGEGRDRQPCGLAGQSGAANPGPRTHRPATRWWRPSSSHVNGKAVNLPIATAFTPPKLRLRQRQHAGRLAGWLWSSPSAPPHLHRDSRARGQARGDLLPDPDSNRHRPTDLAVVVAGVVVLVSDLAAAVNARTDLKPHTHTHSHPHTHTHSHTRLLTHCCPRANETFSKIRIARREDAPPHSRARDWLRLAIPPSLPPPSSLPTPSPLHLPPPSSPPITNQPTNQPTNQHYATCHLSSSPGALA